MPKKDSLNVDDAIFDKLGACSPELAPRLPRLRRLLASSDCADRRAGVDLLAECTQQNEQAAQIVFPFLVGLLEHPDEVIQECAEYGLSDLGPMSFNWILRLLGKLTEKNAAVAVHLIRALGHFKYASETKALWPAAVKQLAQLLDNDSGDVRGAAALSMVELGAKTKPFIQRLVSMSHSTHAVERARALRCLREVSDDDQKLVLQLKPVFLEALGEPDAEAREAIEYALRDCGPKIFPELTRRLSDERRRPSGLRNHLLMLTRKFARQPHLPWRRGNLEMPRRQRLLACLKCARLLPPMSGARPCTHCGASVASAKESDSRQESIVLGRI